MNILIICPHLNVGGVPRYVINLAKGIKQSNHVVTVATYGGKWEEELVANDINLLKIPLNTKSIVSLKIFSSLRIIRNFIKTNNVDIVHANTRVAQFLAFLIRLTEGIPYVSTYHGYYKAHFFRKLFKFEGERVITISNEIKRHVIDDLKISDSKISVVFNGIDPNEYCVEKTRNELRNQYNIIGNPIIGIVARLVVEKNHQLLIKAFKQIIEHSPNAKLVIFGKGRQKDKLTILTEELGIDKKILFIEEGNVKEIFKTFDVAILPSTHEGFGFTIIEAQALGVPVVGSAIGGIKEVIEDNKTGLIFNKFDESLLCDKILLLLNNPDKRNSMVEEALKRVRSTFSIEQMTINTVSVYKQLINYE